MDTGTAAPAATQAAPAATPVPAAPQTAGTTLTSVPTGEWASGFKSEEVKSYITQKGFKSPEALAESYKNLEGKFSTSPDKMLVLPEKMEGDAARAVWERLGAPKEAKGYEISKGDEKADPKFVEAIQGIFHKNNLTKDQAQGVAKEYEAYANSQLKEQQEANVNAIIQGDAALKKQWGAQYDSNIEIAKQGVKILGLDAKTLDLMEAVQGREALYKTLQKIGVGVGESNFVDGQSANPQTNEMTAEQAGAELKSLMNDKKFYKQLEKGNTEARARWDKLNQLASGDAVIPIGPALRQF